MVLALVIIAVGLLFFAKSLGFIDDVTLSTLWPLLLVILGLAMISHKTFGHQCYGDGKCEWCRTVGVNGKGKKRSRRGRK